MLFHRKPTQQPRLVQREEIPEVTTEQTTTENTPIATVNGEGVAYLPTTTRHEMAEDIADALRFSLTDDQRESMIHLAEHILSRVIEKEMLEVLAPRLEALYEGVIAQVMQKLLMQALTERANSTLSQLNRRGG